MANPFALPRGLLGRLAGWMMARSNEAQQWEVLELLDLPPGARLLEVGYGPGVLASLLLGADATLAYTGVDPSEVMREQASPRNREAVSGGRARFLIGDVAHLPVENGFDVAVAVNSVCIWPDIAAAAAELRRVLRPGGKAVITWHGPHAKSAIQRRMAMDEGEMASVEGALGTAFDRVERRSLRSSVAFVAQ